MMKILRRDPLVLIGIVGVIAGAALFSYGVIPQAQPLYSFLGGMHVPQSDPSGNFILSPENYFRQYYAGSGSVDNVLCSVASGGWECYGYQIIGTQTVYSTTSAYYGLILVAISGVSVYAGKRWKKQAATLSQARRVKITIDEDICLANGVCVALAPSVFQFKKEDAPTIFAPMAEIVDPNGANYDTILQAAQMCPTGAIIIEDEESGERIHPPYPQD